MQVTLIVRRRESARIAAVLARSGLVLYACEGIGDDGEGLALLAAAQWAIACGYELVSESGERVQMAA
jgi:hypothetical protein